MSQGQSKSGVVDSRKCGPKPVVRPSRLSLSRKGMDDKLMFLIWECIAIAMVALVLVLAVKGIANNTTYWKKYHSTDLAMMTDLMMTDQGDFSVNYNLKEMHKNWATSLLYVDDLRFQVFLKDGSYNVYDGSIDQDRFPQSFVFAKNRDVNIVQSNLSREYLTIKKSADTLSMDYNDLVVSCPSVDTQKDTKTLSFNSISLDDVLDGTSQYLNSALDGEFGNTADTKEMLFMLSKNAISSTGSPTITIYYDPKSGQEAEKFACLLQKHISANKADISVSDTPYDNSMDSNSQFTEQKKPYAEWMLIRLDTGAMDDDSLANSIIETIKEYYN